jgi:hypothetical protein
MVLCGCGCRKGSSAGSLEIEQGWEGRQVNGHSCERRRFICSRLATDDYYSAEFVLDGLEIPYQFKIWEKRQRGVSVLVKESSNILQLLKVGDTLNVKYYSMRSAYPSEGQKTAVRHITRNEQGRLKGHCLVGLEILGNARE